MARYEFSTDTSSKFWNIVRKRNEIETSYGRIGSKGRLSRKVMNTEKEAIKEVNKLTKMKIAKGYKLVESRKKISSRSNQISYEGTNRLETMEQCFERSSEQVKEKALLINPNSNESDAEFLKWYFLDTHQNSDLSCFFKVDENRLITEIKISSADKKKKVWKFRVFAEAEEAACLSSLALDKHEFRQITVDKYEGLGRTSKSTNLASVLIKKYGNKKLKTVGALVTSLTDKNDESKSLELVKLYSNFEGSRKEYLELMVLALSAGYAIMSDRTDFIMDVVATENPDVEDIDILVDATGEYIEIEMLFNNDLMAVSDVLISQKCIRKHLYILSEKERKYVYELLYDSFDHFIRPLVKKAVQRRG